MNNKVSQKRRGRPPKKIKALPTPKAKRVEFDVEPDVYAFSPAEEIQTIIKSTDNPYSFLSTIEEQSSQDLLQQSFMELVQKNNLALEYKDFDDVIKHIGDYTEKQSEFNKLYVSKMINAIVDIAKVKSMMTLGTLTNKALAVFQKVAEDPSLDSLDVMVSSIREIYDWMGKLDELYQKYYVVGTDKQISMLSNQNNNFDPTKRLTPEALNALVKQINKQVSQDKNKDQKEKK